MEARSLERDPSAAEPAGWKPADPGPLGLAAFAMTTFVLSMINSNFIDPRTPDRARPRAGLRRYRADPRRHVGVPHRQHIRRRRVHVIRAFWISFWLIEVFYAKDITGNVGHAVGLYLWAWAIFTAYMTVAALRTSGAVLLVFVLLTITFVLLAIGNTGPHTTVLHWGGYFGLATALAAWYASFAAVVNSTFGRVVLPIFPLAAGDGLPLKRGGARMPTREKFYEVLEREARYDR